MQGRAIYAIVMLSVQLGAVSCHLLRNAGNSA